MIPALMESIKLSDVQAARRRIKSGIQLTQLMHSRSLSDWFGLDMFLKHENEQRTGSFKIRGALNKIRSLSEEDLARGIVASSAGNHAQGVALSASLSGAKAHIVMPKTSPLIKVTATENYGAQVYLEGAFYDEAYAYAKKLEDEHGYIFVHPFRDPLVIAGQGTIGLELLEQNPDLDSVVVPIGGGGLISGIAMVIKSLKPDCKVYGVVSDRAPAMRHLFMGEKPNPPENISTIAEGIAVKEPSPEIHELYISKYVDDIVEVSDSEIASAMVLLLERAKTVTEGSAAASVAGAMKMKDKWDFGKNAALLLCGGNVDLNVMAQVIEKGLASKGRLTRIRVYVDDRPGILTGLTQILSELGANILEVHHDRRDPQLQIRQTAIDFLLETTSKAHVKQLTEVLDKKCLAVETIH